MFSSLLTPYYKLRQVYSENRRVVLTTVTVSSCVAAYYAYKKYKPLYISLRNDLKLMNKLASDMYTNDQQSKQQQLIQRFIHNCTVSDVTLKNFALQTRIDLINKYDIDTVKQQLRSNKDLWYTFSTLSISRCISTVYCIVLLNCLIKIQLSIVSRYVVNDNLTTSTPSLPSIPGLTPSSDTATSTPTPLPAVQPLPALTLEELNKHYFSFSAHLQSTGLQSLCHIIQSIVQQQIQHIQLNDKLSYTQLIQVITSIKQRVDTEAANISFNTSSSNSNTPFQSYLFPNDSDLDVMLSHMTFNDNKYSTVATTRLREMIYETKLILDNIDFTNALYECIDICFNEVYKLIQHDFYTNDISDNNMIPFATIVVKFVKLFDQLLPEHNINESPLLSILSMQPTTNTNIIQYTQLHQLCQVIFFPLNQLSVLQGKLNDTYKQQLQQQRQQPAQVELLQP